MRRAAVPLGLAVAVVVLVAAGRGDLAAPPVEPSAWSSWVEARGAVPAALAVTRLLALGVAGWLAVASAVSVGARAVGAVRVAAVAERGLPLVLRRASAGLAGVVVLGSAPGVAAAAPTQGEPLVLLPAEGESTATMTVLRDDVRAPEPPPPAPAVTTVETWTVGPGDSFWSIAEEVVGDALGRPPADADVEPYWRTLVAANRDRLVSPNPDLVVPGQVFVLPPLS